jgi:hypothetical protein
MSYVRKDLSTSLLNAEQSAVQPDHLVPWDLYPPLDAILSALTPVFALTYRIPGLEHLM